MSDQYFFVVFILIEDLSLEKILLSIHVHHVIQLHWNFLHLFHTFFILPLPCLDLLFRSVGLILQSPHIPCNHLLEILSLCLLHIFLHFKGLSLAMIVFAADGHCLLMKKWFRLKEWLLLFYFFGILKGRFLEFNLV